MVAALLVIPAWRHDPGVFSFEVALLRAGDCGLIPGMIFVNRIAQRIGLDEGLGIFPVVIV